MLFYDLEFRVRMQIKFRSYGIQKTHQFKQPGRLPIYGICTCFKFQKLTFVITILPENHTRNKFKTVI